MFAVCRDLSVHYLVSEMVRTTENLALIPGLIMFSSVHIVTQSYINCDRYPLNPLKLIRLSVGQQVVSRM